jgi:hypothetical protein
MNWWRAGQTHVEAYKRQFEADAEHFLRLRANEFAPGGLLLLVLPGTLGDRSCGEGAFSAMSHAATELCAQGKIDASLLEDFLFPVYMATEDVRFFIPVLMPCTIFLSLRCSPKLHNFIFQISATAVPIAVHCTNAG